MTDEAVADQAQRVTAGDASLRRRDLRALAAGDEHEHGEHPGAHAASVRENAPHGGTGRRARTFAGAARG